jgi:hypothetical protein
MARDLTAEIEAIIGLDDPIGIGGPDNVGEYTPEAREIAAELPGITSERELQAAIHEIFRWKLTPELAGSIEQYESIARGVWALRNEAG